MQVDAMVAAIECQRETIMRQPLRVHARSRPRLVDKADCAFFQNAGANPVKNVILAHAVEDDIVYPCFVEEGAQQQTGWTGADDGDLRAHSVRHD